MLVAAIERPSAAELAAMRRRPLRLALLPSPPLVWFVLATEGLSLDAPYGVGLHTDAHRAALITSARQVQSWPTCAATTWIEDLAIMPIRHMVICSHHHCAES